MLLRANSRFFLAIHEPETQVSVLFSAYFVQLFVAYYTIFSPRRNGRPRDAWLPVSYMLAHMLTCPSTHSMFTCIHAGTYVNVPVHALLAYTRTCWHIGQRARARAAWVLAHMLANMLMCPSTRCRLT